jgi:hypothetical protein
MTALLTGPGASPVQARGMRAGRGFGGTRPPVNDEHGLRPLTPEEMPPSLNSYVMDPWYEPDAVLGWARERIEEKLNRRMPALSVGENRVHLGWRLLKSGLDGDGVHVFVVKRPAGGKDPGRVGPERGSCKWPGIIGKRRSPPPPGLIL